MTTLVVDGYNAINALPGTKRLAGKNLKEARDEIIRISRKYARSSGYITTVRVVFDGNDEYRYLDRLDISRSPEEVYSRTGEGDEKLIEVVKECSERGRVIICSNDNYVRNMSRGYKASFIKVEELVRKKPSKDSSEDEDEKRINKHLRDMITDEYKKELGL